MVRIMPVEFLVSVGALVKRDSAKASGFLRACFWSLCGGINVALTVIQTNLILQEVPEFRVGHSVVVLRGGLQDQVVLLVLEFFFVNRCTVLLDLARQLSFPQKKSHDPQSSVDEPFQDGEVVVQPVTAESVSNHVLIILKDIEFPPAFGSSS